MRAGRSVGEVLDVVQDGRAGAKMRKRVRTAKTERTRATMATGREGDHLPMRRLMIRCTMGHEDDGEEGADVDDFEDLAEAPGEGEAERDGEDEEDVAADGGDLGGAIVGGIGVVGLQGQRARSLVAVVTDALTWMQGGASWLAGGS